MSFFNNVSPGKYGGPDRVSTSSSYIKIAVFQAIVVFLPFFSNKIYRLKCSKCCSIVKEYLRRHTHSPDFWDKMASVCCLVTCQSTLSSYSWKLTLYRKGHNDSEEVIKEKVCNIFKQYFIAFLCPHIE